ncbi:MAG TPA: polysaccharide deacetylase family protein [Ignavibacteriaceae bacterium]|nr:polysaccharide deacetylase family protein [Ignavibacteriaceae bacterium]
MEVSSRKTLKINQPILLLLGLFFVLGAILTYIFVLKGVFGDFGLSSLMPNKNVVENLFKKSNAKVAILYSNYTKNMLPEESTWLEDNLSTWKKYLSNIKYSYDLITDESIEKGEHFAYEILILPGSKSLSEREISQIKKFLDSGGSVFASSGTASYSNDGKWRGWEFFSEVYGLKFVKEIQSDENRRIHTLRGSLPLTANIPAGFPLKIATWDLPLSVEVLDPRTTQVSYWFNYKLEDGLVREEIKKSAGIVYGTYGKGRFVWFGFELNSIIGSQDDYVYFEKLFNNSLKWLSYIPVAFVKEWPGDYDAAALIAPVVSETNNLNSLTSVFNKYKVKPTYLFNSLYIEDNKDLLKRLSRTGEIAALVDIGYLSSVDDTVNTLNSYQEQKDKLKYNKKLLEKYSVSNIRGAIPYFGLYDQNSIRALKDAGFDYIITDSLSDRSVPKVIWDEEKNKVTAITKTARDDYEVIRDYGLTQPEFQFYTYQEDIDRVLFEGGLYVFKPHSELQFKDEYVSVVDNVLNDLKVKKFWIATAKEISDWAVKKNRVELRVEKRSDNRVVLIISNSGTETLENFKIQVDLYDDAEDVRLSSEIIGTKTAVFNYNRASRIVNVYVTDLKPGESRIYNIDYRKVNT